MNDLIYRQNAIDARCSACGYDCDKSEFVYNAPQDEQVIMCPEHYVLSTLPSADSERKKGKWNRLAYDTFNCPNCGHTFIVVQGESFMNFCPNCNADMRGE